MLFRKIMSRNFGISVIIPVFNGGKFLERAVASALSQPEVEEIVIVDDGSTDCSREVAGELAKKNPGRIRSLRHPDNGNHGAGASRNLGIESAACDWVAFLDSDDYYLPDRFAKDCEALSADPTLDGAYDALGLDLSDEASGWWREAGDYEGLVTMRRRFSPEDLFSHMDPVGIDGSFHTDTILVRKAIFEKTGCMFGNSKFGEDTLLWMQMAAVARLAPAAIDRPVAMRGVHGENSIRDNKNHREQVSAVFAAFRAWDKFHELGKDDVRAFEMSSIHLASDWREMSRAFQASHGFFSSTAWSHFLRWFLVRQFPEDPFLPGFMPKARRRLQR